MLKKSDIFYFFNGRIFYICDKKAMSDIFGGKQFFWKKMIFFSIFLQFMSTDRTKKLCYNGKCRSMRFLDLNTKKKKTMGIK